MKPGDDDRGDAWARMDAFWSWGVRPGTPAGLVDGRPAAVVGLRKMDAMLPDTPVRLEQLLEGVVFCKSCLFAIYDKSAIIA